VIEHCPRKPDWALDWDRIRACLSWIERLYTCPQDPVWHAEGDVGIHTRMVCEALIANPAWRALPESDREDLFIAALTHDIAKPETTREEPDGRITARGHSRAGALRVRELLWRLGHPFARRERIAAMVRHHQAPFWAIEREDPARLVASISQQTRCDHLSLLAEADIRGRICADQADILDRIALFRVAAEEEGCLDRPRPFPSDTARFFYLSGKRDYADAAPFEDFSCTVTLLSGLPGAGKDTWLAELGEGLPVVSLDGLRAEMGVRPTDNQGRVIQAAKEQARVHLRTGRDFIWNATNITRRMRAGLVSLFTDYRAEVRIVYLETSAENLFDRNRNRQHAVPDRVLEKLIAAWELPGFDEAHEVVFVVDGVVIDLHDG